MMDLRYYLAANLRDTIKEACHNSTKILPDAYEVHVLDSPVPSLSFWIEVRERRDSPLRRFRVLLSEINKAHT